jgi:putative ABC transport system permease protein
MNPLRMVTADLRSLRHTAWATVLLIAVAVAVGLAVNAQEQGLRRASTVAADDFDLLIAAPGSQTQLVLTAIYLQPEALPLMDVRVLNTLASDPRVSAAAPIAFGDLVRGYPVVGTTQNFISRWGRVTPAEGRSFEREAEAVIGAEVGLAVGDKVVPSHAMAGRRTPFGVEGTDEATHRHEGASYTVVGRLPPFGSPWDRAILVPIESVWETHGLSNGHAAEDGKLGPPFDAEKLAGVPAIVVKPRAVNDAYALRQQYRQGGTMAFFPAEVLVSLYRTIGDVREILVVASILNDVLIFAVAAMLFLALASLRRRRYAVLRALGASRFYILLTVWLGTALPLALGCLGGLALGTLASAAASKLIEARTGLTITATIDGGNIALVAGLILLASLVAIVPALLIFRSPVAESLREG